MKDYLYQVLYRLRNSNPIRFVTLGYLIYVLAGFVLLSLPVAQNTAVSALDNLFVATSALSTTGLSPVTVSEVYTFFGQLVILILIQLGGIGYMTFGSFVVLTTKRVLEARAKNIAEAVFSIPKNFKIEEFIISVILFTAVIEIAGAIPLFFIFLKSGAPNPIWQAIFHSVSAFCTAGFGLFPNSFEGFKDDFGLNFVISILSILGALGFIVCVDVWKVIRGKQKRPTFTTRIIVAATFWLLVGGTALIFLTESFGGQYSPESRLLYSFFQAMTALTTVGFNTVTIGTLTRSVIMLLTILMIIGASPSGTGGGLKTTTFSAIFALIKSTMQGSKEVRFGNEVIPDDRVRTAVATLSIYLTTLGIGTYLLLITEPFSFHEVFFESASALGTVGLSMGITASLTSLGKILITLMMFIGRVGPLTFGMALFVKPQLIFDDEVTDLAV